MGWPPSDDRTEVGREALHTDAQPGDAGSGSLGEEPSVCAYRIGFAGDLLGMTKGGRDTAYQPRELTLVECTRRASAKVERFRLNRRENEARLPVRFTRRGFAAGKHFRIQNDLLDERALGSVCPVCGRMEATVAAPLRTIRYVNVYAAPHGQDLRRADLTKRPVPEDDATVNCLLADGPPVP